MTSTWASRRPKPSTTPTMRPIRPLHILDRGALSDSDVAVLTEECPPGAIDLDMKEKSFFVDVGAIVVATGWRGYDPANLPKLGFGRCPDVVSNLMVERFAAPGGPTGGKILRPSNGEPPTNVAFVQCAGSRDENHLAYCSGVCCMGSLKQARYIREQSPDAKITIFYIDIRTLGRLEKFYYDLLEDENITFVKGKVAEINEDPDTHELILEVEDTIVGERPSLPLRLCGVGDRNRAEHRRFSHSPRSGVRRIRVPERSHGRRRGLCRRVRHASM